MHGVQGQMANSREIAQRAQLENQMENRALVEELISAKKQVFDGKFRFFTSNDHVKCFCKILHF